MGRLGLVLGLGSKPHVVGWLGSGPRVGVGRVICVGYFGGGVSRGSCLLFCCMLELSPGGLSPRVDVSMLFISSVLQALTTVLLVWFSDDIGVTLDTV